MMNIGAHMIDDELRAKVSEQYRRSFRKLAKLEASGEQDEVQLLQSACDETWKKERENFSQLATAIREIRQKHSSLGGLYLYDSTLADKQQEFDERRGALTLPPGLSGAELVEAQIRRADRIHELNISLQEILREDIKLVGDEDRRTYSIWNFWWGIGLALAALAFSIVVNVVMVFSERPYALIIQKDDLLSVGVAGDGSKTLLCAPR